MLSSNLNKKACAIVNLRHKMKKKLQHERQKKKCIVSLSNIKKVSKYCLLFVLLFTKKFKQNLLLENILRFCIFNKHTD